MTILLGLLCALVLGLAVALWGDRGLRMSFRIGYSAGRLSCRLGRLAREIARAETAFMKLGRAADEHELGRGHYPVGDPGPIPPHPKAFDLSEGDAEGGGG